MLAVAEVPAFLVKDRLQHILAYEVIILPSLKSKISNAIKILQDLSDFLRHAEHQQGSSDDKIHDILESIYGVEDVVDAYLLRRTHQKRKRVITKAAPFSLKFLMPFCSQLELSKGIGKFMKSVSGVASATELDSWSSGIDLSLLLDQHNQQHHWEDISDHLEMDQKEDIEKLVSQCMTIRNQEDQDLQILSVVQGSGNKKLVMRVYNKQRVKSYFDVRMWVSVHGGSLSKELLVDLIQQVTSKRLSRLDEMEDEEVKRLLFKSLAGMRYLIVLDNFCTPEVWHDLAFYLPDSKNGSRVVLVAEDASKAQRADPWDRPLQLNKIICEDKSWELLLNQVSKSVRESIHDTEIRALVMKKVKEKCCGSHLAIGLLGGILYDTELSRWEEMIDKVPASEEEKEKEGSHELNTFTLNFNQLPTVLKVCFLYLGLFPKESEIPVRRLLQLWLAEGFFDLLSSTTAYGGKEPEDVAKICFQKLVNRKLIEVITWEQDGVPKSCWMSGLLYDLLHPISVAKRLFDVYPEQRSVLDHVQIKPCRRKNSNSRRLADYSGIKICPENCSAHLRSYLSFNTKIRGTPNREIGSFFETLVRKKGFAFVKVLHLEGVYKPVLTEAIGKLLLLRILGLRTTVLDSLPSSVGDLPLLETLDLKHTNVSTLPNSIWKSKSLRHFYVNDVRVDGYSQKLSRGSLTNLQTMSGLYIVGKKAVTNVLERLANLRKVRLTCHKDSIEAVGEWISRLEHLESLKLRCIDGSGRPSKLTLTSMMKHKKLYNLYLLGELEISEAAEMLEGGGEGEEAAEMLEGGVEEEEAAEILEGGGEGEEDDSDSDVEILEPNREVEVQVEYPVHMFKLTLPNCLRKITLSMSKLEDDPMPVLGQLPELIILRLFADSYTGRRMTCLTGGFPKLRVMKLWKLHRLRFWSVKTGAMPCLKELEVRLCEKVDEIDGLQHLSCLEEIILTNMHESFVEDFVETLKEECREDLRITVNNWTMSYFQETELGVLSKARNHSESSDEETELGVLSKARNHSESSDGEGLIEEDDIFEEDSEIET